MKDRFQLTAFVVSAMVLSVVYGTAAAKRGWFPDPQIALALETIEDVRANWMNDLQLQPTRHLVPAHATGRPEGFEGLRVARPEAVTPGYTLIAGLSPKQERSAFEVALYDAEGKIVHEWPVDYAILDPEGKKPLNVMLHGMEVFADGSIAVTFDDGDVLARLDACGQPMWVTHGGYHHAVTSDGQGGLWVWRGEVIVRLDENTGEETFTLDLRDEIIPAGEDGQQGVFSIRSHIQDLGTWIKLEPDPWHANDVEALRPEMAAAFPGFEAGDLLISLRELNLVAVIDPESGELRWWQHGPWLKQHDPDFQPDGTISVYDNNTGSGISRILSVDPQAHETEVLFKGSDEIPFYSWQRGKHQMLPGGNILITETQHGRVLEVAPDGGLVWERDMGWDADRNLVVTEARHVPADFWPEGPPSCMVTAELAGAG